MFIYQVMYAEKLVKILNLILRVRDYEQRQRIVRLQVKSALQASPDDSALLDALEKQLVIVNNGLKQYFVEVNALQGLGITRPEYEQKFRLISCDCLKIGHGSVQPPKWEAVSA